MPATKPPAERTWTDAAGRTVHVPEVSRRIVSLVPSQTELLADLGLSDEVVGLTRFCVHPEGWKATKAIVGGTKQLNARKVAALKPDLVLANLEENTREMVEAVAPLCPVYVTHVRTVPEALSMIRTVGELVGRPDAAADLAEAIGAGFDVLRAAPPLRVAYLIWRDPYMTIGGDTFIHDVLARASLVNAFGHQRRYPTVTPDDLRSARLDALLLSSEPYPFTEAHANELRAHLPSVPVHLVDGELCSWYGSRLRHTPAYLHRLRAELDAGG